MQNSYDVIIVGSGAGGLIAGAFLSQSGYKVLILEQHTIPGGYLHGFKRKGFFFDSAVYSLSGCGPNGYIYYLLKKLNLLDNFDFIEYSSIYKAKLPFGDYTLPAGYDNFKNYLIEQFANEKENIESMMAEMLHLYEVIEFEKFGKPLDQKEFFNVIQKWGKKSYKEFIDTYINDTNLRTLLYSLWLFCALPEDKASSLYGVLMLTIHIVESSFYIKGGCDNLAKILANYIKNNKGDIKFSKTVNEFTTDNGLVTGVKTDSGEEYFAKVVISNASAKDTLKNFIKDQSYLPNLIKRRIDKLDPSISFFALYVVAKVDDRYLSPFDDANQIFYLEDSDNNLNFEGSLSEDKEPFKNLLITEIPNIQKEGYKTYNIYSLMSYNRCSDWALVKGQLVDKMLQKVKNIVGDYWQEVYFAEGATPKTFYRYTLNTNGAVYGFENTSDGYKGAKMENTTGIKNLFLGGHWTKPGGSVYNAMTSGYKAFELAKDYLEKNFDNL